METLYSTWSQLKQLRPLEVLEQSINFLLIIATALIIWKSLMVVSGSESPIVVVLSGSMEPAFYRGDLLFLSLGGDELTSGDVVVFKLPKEDIPIVHRMVNLHITENGDKHVLTKGDNNPYDARYPWHDRALYRRVNPDLWWISDAHIVGRAWAFLPYVGYVTILMNDYPYLKVVLILGLAVVVLTGREES